MHGLFLKNYLANIYEYICMLHTYQKLTLASIQWWQLKQCLGHKLMHAIHILPNEKMLLYSCIYSIFVCRFTVWLIHIIKNANIVEVTSNLVLTHFKDIQHICMQALYIFVCACYIHIINRLDSVSAAMMTSKNIVRVTSTLVLTHFKDIQHICMQWLYICVYAYYIHIIKVLNCVSDAIVGVSSTPV